MNAWSDDRLCALDHIRVWCRHWQATTGVARVDARRELAAAIGYFRTYHQTPADARYAAAVEHSQARQRRAAA
jgi:hypothetical protein